MSTTASRLDAPTSAGLLAGKRLLITGVLTPKSIAYAIADACVHNGASVVLTSFGRAMSLTEKSAQRLGLDGPVLELDATKPEQMQAVAHTLHEQWGSLDGVLHAIGFAPDDALGGKFMSTPWESVATAMQVSAFSLKSMAAAFAPLMPNGGSIAAITFDATVAWPIYDWMGPTKAALESVVRYLARDLGRQGIRVNSMSAGPLETMAAKSIPGFDAIKNAWSSQSPLGWDSSDPSVVAGTIVYLMSDLSRGVTGELIHVDGGYHPMGAPIAKATNGQ